MDKINSVYDRSKIVTKIFSEIGNMQKMGHPQLVLP